MYVAMPYFVFMDAMVSCLTHGENTSLIWNPCFLFHCAVLWTNVRMSCVPKLHKEPNDAMVLHMIFRVFCHAPY